MLLRPNKRPPKDTYEVEFKQEAFYTGGRVEVTCDGQHLVSTCRDAVKVIDVNTGLLVHTISQEDDPAVTCFCVTPDGEHLIVSSQNSLLRLWDWRNNFLIRSWKSIHSGPILEMTVDRTSTLLATGSSDMTVKVWDVDRKYWTHNLKGHRGVITAVKFHDEKLWLISSSMDLIIKIWNLQNSVCLANLEGHYSAVTSFVIDSRHCNTLVSGGRDNVLLVWDLETKQRTGTIPVYEGIESLVEYDRSTEDSVISSPSLATLHVITAGSKGQLRVWNTKTRQCVYEQPLPDSLVKKDNTAETDVHSIVEAFYVPSLKQICTTNHEHNILFYSISDLTLSKQFIGNNEEIMDVQLFGANEELLALATNSNTVKVYNLADFDSESLHGHTDLVMCLAVSSDGHLLLSGSKDNTAILWRLGDEGVHDIHKIYTAYGHTQHVSSLTFPRLSSSYFMTGGVDNTLKVWTAGGGSLADSAELIRCKQTVVVHDRDINSIDVSPNDKLVVTASRDKTAKVWRGDSLDLVGVLRGHKRGIWKAKFSPVDQCVITASADSTVKMFALSDFSCIKTFEGHECPVLNVCFVTRGMQFISCDDTGLIKLWNVKDNELVATFEGHSERCWALTCCRDTQDRMVSAGTDAAIIIWKDVTEEKVIKERKKQEKGLLQ